ncbi:MAG: permease for cytosine/purines uracil thiamine allantoin [Gammaproteobacteria bacterium]|nr:permease for cytosine/purines uracil thiamine allantoin [Gammaproteobacteria bacterium]
MQSSSDDRAATNLPESARISRWPLTMMWWASCSAIAYLFLGVQLAVKFGTANALIGMVAAALAMGTIGGILSPYSLRTGASSSVLSQTMFGARGGSVPTLILCITCLYYAVFEGAVVAMAAVRVWPGMSYEFAVVLVVLYSAPLSIGTVQNFLNRLNAALLPFYVLGLVMLAFLAVRQHGYSDAWLHLGPSRAPSLAGCWNSFVPYFGTLALAMITMDIARFGKAKNHRYHSRFNFGVPFYLLTYLPAGAIGIFLVGTVSPAHVSDTTVLDACLLVLGAVTGLIWVTVTQTRINSANFYVATVNLQAFLEEALRVRVPKEACAAAVGIAALLFMRSTNILGTILVAVHYLGIFLIAWVGVAVSHVLSAGGAAIAAPVPTHSKALEWRGLLAWFAGVAAGVGLGFVGGSADSFAAPATLSVSAFLYRILYAEAPIASPGLRGAVRRQFRGGQSSDK